MNQNLYCSRAQNPHLYTCPLDELEMSIKKKKKTILRTIRLSEDIDDLLEKDAQNQNVSANALISKIMTRYVEWDRIIEKTSYIVIASPLFRALINETNDQKLEEIGKKYVYEAIKELAMVEFGKTDFKTLLNAFFLVSKYDTGLRTSAPSPAENESDSQSTITIYHDWGPKGSIILKGYFDNLAKTELGRQPAISATDDAITVSFPKLSKPRP